MQEGETDEYVNVIRAYQQPIYRYCLRLLVNAQDAEDAAQDIFIKAFESIRHYRRMISFSSWLYTIAYRHCLNLLRKRKYQLQLLPRLLRTDAAAESPEQSLDNRLFSPALTAALAALSPEDRSLLILHIFEERTYAEISEITGQKPDALKKRVSRMKEKARSLIRDWREEEPWNGNNQPVNGNI
ncbi:RNA polymerase sigma factor [Cohnella soli]|uniref:RNA polymerase sigma factor n=1 Tax=Cohnella soli TaxID=425005 RepID=A0ABW0HJZ4_9BACL